MLVEAQEVCDAAGSCGARPAWALSDEDLVTCLDLVRTATTRLAAVNAHLLRELDGRGLPLRHGATSTVAWLRDHLRMDGGQAKRWIHLAHALADHPALDAAVADGTISAEHATTIATTLSTLPLSTTPWPTTDTASDGSAQPGDDPLLRDAGPQPHAGPRPGEAAAPSTTPQVDCTDESTARDPACFGVEPTVIEAAEALLIKQATQFDPKTVRQLGERILTHVAPEIAERVEAAALRRREERAHQSRGIRLTGLGDGRVRVSGHLDTEGAALFSAAIGPLANPLRGDNPDAAEHLTSTTDSGGDTSTPTPASDCPTAFGGPAEGSRRRRVSISDPALRRTADQRRADALVELCRFALRHQDLPVDGGDSAHITVVMPYEPLRQAIGTATLDTGERLSATAVRRLACDATLVPAVLDGKGQPLDLGHNRRLITGSLRRALVLRDRGCCFPGCDRPPRWTQGHHLVEWSRGGPTDLANTALLCGHHHRFVHHSAWSMRLGADGHPEFVPPPWMDPDRVPRRNTYHRRL